MIVGPGESLRYLDRTLRNAGRWADEIIVYGDGPDADTWDAVGHYASHMHLDQENRWPTDESAVRNGLFELLDRVLADGDIVIILDADEELWPLACDSPASLLRTLAADRDADAWRVLFWHLWAPDGSVMRVDGMWRPNALYRIYRHRLGGRVQQRALACWPVPDGLALSGQEPILVMAHWGYARPHDRALKYKRYMHLDGGRYHPLAHLQSILQEPSLERPPYPVSPPIARSCNP
jgi:hypothetical protein